MFSQVSDAVVECAAPLFFLIAAGLGAATAVAVATHTTQVQAAPISMLQPAIPQPRYTPAPTSAQKNYPKCGRNISDGCNQGY